MPKQRSQIVSQSSGAKAAKSKAVIRAAEMRVLSEASHEKSNQSWFTWFAHAVAHWAGKPAAFLIALAIIIIWAASGPLFGFSDTWQLVINTSTTIITFLMVFLIQNTQNRDAKAVHLKLDEIIRAIKGARNELVDLEELSDEELKKLEDQFQRLRKQAEHNGTQSRKAQSAKSR